MVGTDLAFRLRASITISSKSVAHWKYCVNLVWNVVMDLIFFVGTFDIHKDDALTISAIFLYHGFLRDLTGMLGGVMFTFYYVVLRIVYHLCLYMDISGTKMHAFALIAEAKHSKKCGYCQEKTNKHIKTTCPLNPNYIAKLARIDVDEQAARIDANEQATRIDAAEQATNVS
ncbi:hypothetical protein Tco_0008188 [Tanacetum coccineum]